jgi:hypothetical protein
MAHIASRTAPIGSFLPLVRTAVPSTVAAGFSAVFLPWLEITVDCETAKGSVSQAGNRFHCP